MISLVGHQFFMKNRWRFVPCFIFSSRKRWLSCKIYSSRWCKSPFSFRIFVVKGINLRRLSITSMLSSILEIFYYIASGDNLFLMLTNCSCLINNPAKLLDRIFTAYFLFTSINMEWFFLFISAGVAIDKWTELRKLLSTGSSDELWTNSSSLLWL